MSWLRRLMGAAFSLSLLLVLFFTAFQGVVFNKSYIESEMKKLDIAKSVQMERTDLLELFWQMLDYLSDKRDNLVIEAPIGGEVREAFNDREKRHMVDVKKLFDSGFAIRNGSLAVLLGTAAAAAFWKGRRKEFWRTYGKSLSIVFGAFFAAALAVIGLFMIDFNRYFTIFHLLFFDNDLWILDPATDLMINIVPEPFFYDTAMTIGLSFLIPAFCIFLGSILYWVFSARNRKRKE